MSNNDPFERIAAIIKRDIAPSVSDEYARTQAHMAAIVISRLGRQLSLKGVHDAADAAAMDTLIEDLTQIAGNNKIVATALSELATGRDRAALSALIETLYQHQNDLPAKLFDTVLKRIRKTLRADIERRMAYSR